MAEETKVDPTVQMMWDARDKALQDLKKKLAKQKKKTGSYSPPVRVGGPTRVNQ